MDFAAAPVHPPLQALRQALLDDPVARHALQALPPGADLVDAVVEAGATRGLAFAPEDVYSLLGAGERAAVLRPALPPGAWTPTGLRIVDGAPRLTWIEADAQGYAEPFPAETVRRLGLARPASRLLLVSTPLEAGLPAAPLAGIVFHMSRCGSTLVSRMLAALPGAAACSEPAAFDQALGTLFQAPAPDPATHAAWLRAAVAALAAGAPEARRLFVKADSWHAPWIPAVARAFPDVPRLFVYRDPVEVLASHARQRGSQGVPGLLHEGWLGVAPDPAHPADLDAYTARVLGRICGAAADHAEAGLVRLVPFRTLPEALWTEDPLGLAPGPEDVARMREVTAVHAKRPHEAYQDDREAKRAEAGDRLRELAETHVGPAYARLEAAYARQRGA